MKILFLHDCAGVALELSRELERRGHQADLYFFANDPYIRGYDPHKIRKGGKGLTLFLARKIVKRYDIIHTYNTRFPNHRPYDYYLMRMLRKKVVIHFHGSDLRLRSRSKAVKSLLNNKVCLVSTPDLLRWAPNAEWLPNPVDPTMCKPMSFQSHDDIRIIHPATDYRLKGTRFVTQAIDELKGEGYNIDLRVFGPSHPIPLSDMPNWYGWCDIVLNEMLCGIHGLVGIEGMMCGKPVVSTYQESVRKTSNPPIVTVKPGDVPDLKRVLEDLINSPEKRREIGQEGRKWSSAVHNTEKVVDQLLRIYRTALGKR